METQKTDLEEEWKRILKEWEAELNKFLEENINEIRKIGRRKNENKR